MHVSLIIPAYNASPTLEETLDSVAGQTRIPDEIIVVDDGSTDETADIASTHHLKPRLISTKNQGAASAFNLGIQESHGDVLCFLDADDLWEPDKTELQLQQLQTKSDLHAVLGQTVAFACPSVPKEVVAKLQYVAGVQPGYLIGTLMLRRSWVDRHGLLMDRSLRTGYFIHWFSQMREKGIREHMLNSLVHRRRIRPGTLSARNSMAENGLSKDFLEIARRALMAKRRKAPG